MIYGNEQNTETKLNTPCILNQVVTTPGAKQDSFHEDEQKYGSTLA